MKLCLWAALITLFWLQSHLGQCLDAFLHALSGLWTCKQWKSKNVWIWPRESLQGRGCTHPPPPPTPHLGFTMQKKLVRQIEELRGNGETVSDAAMQQTISRTFPPLIQNLVMIYRLSHVRSDWYIKKSKQPLNSITWQLIDRRMMYTYVIPLVPFIIILIFTAAI